MTSYSCEILDQPAQLVVSMRKRVALQDLPVFLGQAYDATYSYLTEMGVAVVGAPFVAYYSMDMQDMDVEAGFPIAQALAGKGEVKAGEIPACQMATLMYEGPYNDLEPAYAALTQWMSQKGLQPTGIAYEMYLNDPATTPPQELKTLVAFPIK